MTSTNAYSRDLRLKTLAAIDRGIPRKVRELRKPEVGLPRIHFPHTQVNSVRLLWPGDFGDEYQELDRHRRVERRGRALPHQETCGSRTAAPERRGGSVAGRSYLPRDLKGRLPVWLGGGAEDREDALRWHPLPK